jgi:hypothetical protein
MHADECILMDMSCERVSSGVRDAVGVFECILVCMNMCILIFV